MDPICHTLVGATLSETGLKERTPYAAATLLIGANLPDVDVLAYLWGPVTMLVVRRGWTHGVLGLVVLPLVLVGLVLGWDRLRSRRFPGREAARGAQLVILAYLAVVTHPLLDFLNVYGMRWLMPFVDRWVYGDVLFIADPWVWLILAAGMFWSRRRWRIAGERWSGPARVALVVFTGYVACMVGLALWGRVAVARRLERAGVAADARIMVAPVPIDPLRRHIVVDTGDDGYRLGEVRWRPTPTVTMDPQPVARRRDDPRARRAAASPRGRAFLSWARFPFYVISESAASTTVHIVDARYTLDPDAPFGAVSIPLAPTP